MRVAMVKGRAHRPFFCSVLKIDGVFWRMLMHSEAETAKSVGMAAENINDVLLTRWCSTTIRGPA